MSERTGLNRSKEKRDDLFGALTTAMASECSPWYTPCENECPPVSPLTDRANTVAPAATPVGTRPHVLLQPQPNATPHHAAASVWADEPLTPLAESSAARQTSFAATRALSSAVLSVACSVVRPLQTVRGTVYLTATELVFMVDPAFKEEREKQVRAMEEKLANGRRGENKWLLLDRLKNESWKMQGLESEEYRLFLVLLKKCRLWIAARCGRRALLRERTVGVPGIRVAEGPLRLPHGAAPAPPAALDAVPGCDGGGALEERQLLRAMAEGRVE